MVKLIRKTTAHMVADSLRERIMSGSLKEGEQLKQEAIADLLGVSRIPVREALRQLESEGLVTLVSHKGAVVTTLETSEIVEMFDLRIMLECFTLKAAIPNMSEADFASAGAVLDGMISDPQIEEWGTRNWDFHEILYKPAGKPATLNILRRIHANIDRYIRIQIALTHGEEKAHREHQAILAACAACDGDTAARLLASHIGDVRDALLARHTAEGKA